MKFRFPSPDWRPHHSEAPNPNAPTRHMSSMVKRTLFEKNRKIDEHWDPVAFGSLGNPVILWQSWAHISPCCSMYISLAAWTAKSFKDSRYIKKWCLQQAHRKSKQDNVPSRLERRQAKKNETLSMQSQRLRICTGRFQVQLVNVPDFGWQTPWMSKPMKAKST